LSGVWLPVLTSFLGEPPRLTPWTEAEMKQRKERKELPPQTRCLPMGLGFQGFFIEFRIMQSPELVAMINGNSDPARQFYLDGRSHPKDPNPSFMGHSIGHWDGDTLVVVTVGFNSRVWLGLGDYPQTETLHVSERYRRPDLGHLQVEITYEDPAAFKKPWTTKQFHSLAPKGFEMCLHRKQPRSGAHEIVAAPTIAWPHKTRELQNAIFDSTRWNGFKFRDDDIVIATWAKSGTTWMQQIVGQMVFRGAEGLPIEQLSPWLDFRPAPIEHLLNGLEEQTNRRFIKTHLPLDGWFFRQRRSTCTSAATDVM
jgi:hypothetical protein